MRRSSRRSRWRRKTQTQGRSAQKIAWLIPRRPREQSPPLQPPTARGARHAAQRQVPELPEQARASQQARQEVAAVAAPSLDTARRQLRSQHGPQSYDTICGVQRALWPYIDLLPEPQRSQAEDLLATACVMGSKMNARLVELKQRSE